MDSVPDSIYFKDADGRYLRINQAKAARSGFRDPAEAIGKSDADVFPAAHAQQARADELQVLATGQPMIGKEEYLTWPDGKHSWVATTRLPLLDREGKIVGTFGISHDITGQKQAAEQMRSRQGSRRGRQPRQERFPGQHEPRDPHAAERHHRHDGVGARHRPGDFAARIPEAGLGVRRIAAVGDQRYSGFFQDRGRQTDVGVVRVRPPRKPGRRPQIAGLPRASHRAWNWPPRSIPTCPNG